MPSDAAASQLQSQIQPKRILYVKSIVRMLRLSGSKNQQLLSTPEGVKGFHSAVIDLLRLFEGIATKDNHNDIVHMMIEIVGSLQSQGEFTSK